MWPGLWSPSLSNDLLVLGGKFLGLADQGPKLTAHGLPMRSDGPRELPNLKNIQYFNQGSWPVKKNQGQLAHAQKNEDS